MLIRHATQSDLLAIRVWLEEEARREGERGFLNNMSLIEDGQRKRELTVLLEDSMSPAAFCLASDRDMHILEVRPDRRGQGLGRRLVEHVLSRSRDAGSLGMCGHCCPEESLPFWLHIGFKHVPDHVQAYRIAYPFRRARSLIPNAPTHDVTFTLFTDYPAETVRKTRTITASCLGGSYQLAEDFVEYASDPDELLRIEADDRVLYAGKSKYVDRVGGEHRSPWIRASVVRVLK
jgi:GNAT superfamily N-acetyltransferase